MPIPAGGSDFPDGVAAPVRPIRTYWTGSRFLVDWTLTDAAGLPVIDADVQGEVTLPTGATVPMVVTSSRNVYTAAVTASMAGTHGYRLWVTNLVEDATEGAFVVARSRAGLPPIQRDPTTPVGMVRLLITDVNDQDPLLEDDQLAALLAAESGDVKLAAASALEVIARSELLVAKKITTQDLSTDGPAVASELRAQAESLRKQVAGAGGGGQALLPVWSFPPPVPWGDDYL